MTENALDVLPGTFWTAPTTAVASVTTKQMRAIMLYSDGWILARGRMWDFESKNLGAGVHRLTLKART